MAYTKVTGALVGSISDLDLTNVGDIELDSITGDGDTNTSITFSGSDVITIATGGSGRLTIGDGAISPVTDNQIDLGTSSLKYKDGYIDGTLHTDAINLNGTAITADASELNLLDGVSGLVQADLTKLAAVDATAVELNYVDGVTSAIQTQMDTKASTGKAIAMAIVFG